MLSSNNSKVEKISVECNKFCCKPLIFQGESGLSKEDLNKILHQIPGIKVFDEISSQCEELIKIRNPGESSSSALASMANDLVGEHTVSFGAWVFYPWLNNLVHTLAEDDFVELRTARNKYKITPEEQEILRYKKVGIIGLSVGKSAACCIALERTAGEIRIADFDDLALSNMNRLNAGLHEIGLLKAVVVAREIAELDPYLLVVPFMEGITAGNIDSFLTENGRLDVLVEECDGIDIKILSRIKAKEHRIPVIMETNDRGMIDIERYDLDPDYPYFHGAIEHLDITDLDRLRKLSNQEKLPYISAMVGLENLSTRLLSSLPEIGKTITTWPQLGSSVVLGAALVTDTLRRILLKEFNQSGRFHVDFAEIIK